jgi:hypothetical protein
MLLFFAAQHKHKAWLFVILPAPPKGVGTQRRISLSFIRSFPLSIRSSLHLYAPLKCRCYDTCRYFIFLFKMFVMSVSSFSFGIGLTNIPLSSFPGRRRRPWVSFVHTGCYIDRHVFIVYRCPVVGGVAQLHLAWQHRVVPM